MSYLNQEEVPNDKKKKDLVRIASFHFLCCLDNQLKVATGQGLSAFCSPKTPARCLPDPAPAARRRPLEAAQPLH